MHTGVSDGDGEVEEVEDPTGEEDAYCLMHNMCTCIQGSPTVMER